ncbi:hypothetical protein HPB51_018905 [Rhipicephalus microplus]|uniref:Transposable element P transposase-like RNase H domain-containing protein n=1 Tax=Rhipicephalus microplus TaxID=6941 RepID=A0A9J6D6F8_RHIMP|nr:hypothetical protein HPB51_018905 [Rhipicephalus microplus]
MKVVGLKRLVGFAEWLAKIGRSRLRIPDEQSIKTEALACKLASLTDNRSEFNANNVSTNATSGEAPLTLRLAYAGCFPRGVADDKVDETTLQRHMRTTARDVGYSELVKQRLNTEMKCLRTEQAEILSLIIDEMRIKQGLEYHKQRDAFLGDTDMGPLNQPSVIRLGKKVYDEVLWATWNESAAASVRVPYGLRERALQVLSNATQEPGAT